MSCYLRHLRGLFESLGLEYDKPNRDRVDTAIRSLLGFEQESGCPDVWAAIKGMPDQDRLDLVGRVASRLDGIGTV